MTGRFAVAAGAAGVAALIAGAPASAHHAIGSVVDTSKTLQSAMVLTKVDWINPHAWFHFSMTKADGSIVKDVAVEWMGLSGLRQAGFTSADAFTVGRSYTVTYYPNRDGSVGGHLVSMIDPTTSTVVGRATAQPAAAAPAPLVAAPAVQVPMPRERYSVLGNGNE